MKSIPKIILSAPVGVVPYLNPVQLNQIDSKSSMGIALTYDIMKQTNLTQDIHNFIAQKDRFVMLWPLYAKINLKNMKAYVKTSYNTVELDETDINKLTGNQNNFDLIVAYNTQYNQFKHNITRTDFIKEYAALSQHFKCFFISKQFQVDILQQGDIIFTADSDIIDYLISSQKIDQFKVILNATNSFQLIQKYYHLQSVSFLTEIPQFYALKYMKYDVLKKNEFLSISYENFRNLEHKDSFERGKCTLECCKAYYAYIYHLVNCNEQLGIIYLMMHNCGQLISLCN